MSEVLEVVTFTVKDEDREEFLGGREAAIAALAREFDALIEARLAEYDDGTWIDVLRWRTRDDAEAAMEAMPKIAEACSWASRVDEVRDFRHAAVHHRFDAAAA